MKIGIIITSLASYACIIVVQGVTFLATLPFYLFPNSWAYDNKLRWRIFYIYNYLLIRAFFIPVRYVGNKNCYAELCVMVANHQSIIDMSFFNMLSNGEPCAGPFKKEVASSLMNRVIFINIAWYIDRSQPRVALRELLQHADAIKDQKIHIGYFPEGTRYYDGEIHEFFSGFAVLAKKLNRPVVPVRIFGAHELLRPGSWLIYRRPVTVCAGQPMRIKEDESVEEFKDRVHAWFVAQKIEDWAS